MAEQLDILAAVVAPRLSALAITSQDVGHILLWCMGLLLAVIASGLVVLWLRRRVRQADESGGGSFSIEALEKMRASGELTEDEFRLLRRAALPLGLTPEDDGPEDDENSTLSPPYDGDDVDGGCAQSGG